MSWRRKRPIIPLALLFGSHIFSALTSWQWHSRTPTKPSTKSCSKNSKSTKTSSPSKDSGCSSPTTMKSAVNFNSKKSSCSKTCFQEHTSPFPKTTNSSTTNESTVSLSNKTHPNTASSSSSHSKARTVASRKAHT